MLSNILMGYRWVVNLPAIFLLFASFLFFCSEFYYLLSLLASWILELTH